jgi:predicted site-specific integrase-resolvase
MSEAVQERRRVGNLNLDDVAWLCGVECETVLEWVKKGVVRAGNGKGGLTFERAHVAALLERMGA